MIVDLSKPLLKRELMLSGKQKKSSKHSQNLIFFQIRIAVDSRGKKNSCRQTNLSQGNWQCFSGSVISRDKNTSENKDQFYKQCPLPQTKVKTSRIQYVNSISGQNIGFLGYTHIHIQKSSHPTSPNKPTCAHTCARTHTNIHTEYSVFSSLFLPVN